MVLKNITSSSSCTKSLKTKLNSILQIVLRSSCGSLHSYLPFACMVTCLFLAFLSFQLVAQFTSLRLVSALPVCRQVCTFVFWFASLISKLKYLFTLHVLFLNCCSFQDFRLLFELFQMRFMLLSNLVKHQNYFLTDVSVSLWSLIFKYTCQYRFFWLNFHKWWHCTFGCSPWL